MVPATPAVLLSVFCTGAVDRMGSSPRPTLACLSPHTDLQREGLQCLLSASRSFLPAHLSRLLVCRTRSRDVQGYGKFLVFRDSQEATACVVAGIMSGTTAASREVLDTLLALRRLSLAEKMRGLGRRAGLTPGCSVVNLVQGGVSTSEHAQALVIF